MLAAGMFASMLVAVIIVQTYNERREKEALRAVAVAEAKQREVSRAAACQLIKLVLAAYQEDPNPPASKTRENLIEAWRTIGIINKCF
jgi:type II secretory pathway pseudopilin PulG